tara:strand:+ start:73 stop:885 length:813 start_codon:yes stop_codon:yes gene_type:complete
MSSESVHTNLVAYNDHERHFNASDIDPYRSSKLLNAQKNVSFVQKYFDNKINVLEIGSGNSKFLYSLELSNMLREGYGVEISESRFNFANNWKEDLGIKNVTNINANILEYDMSALPKFDLIYCVDLAFQFFDPVAAGSDAKILQKAYEHLNENGKIILELDCHDRILNKMDDGVAKLWQEFDEPDPWRYLLWDCAYNDEQQHLHLSKVFIKRDLSQLSDNKVILKNYQRKDIKDLLIDNKYVNITFYENWQNNDETLSDEFIVVGEKHA